MKRWRRFLAIATALTLVAISARLWFIDGLLRRITIDGPSMAPALCGAHYDVTCHDCHFPFRIDAESPPKNGAAACPNCGFAENKLNDASLQSADRVIIDRWPLLWRRSGNGEVIAARLADETSSLIVKRVAAVAPQTVGIENGDLFVNGKLQRKTLTELRTLRVLVHDNEFRPRQSADLPPRWRSQQEDSGWIAAGNTYSLEPLESPSAELDWLEYQHWPCTVDPSLRGVAAPVRDNDSYNQGPGPRELNAVPDVMLSCRVRCTGDGELRFVARDGEQQFEADVLSLKSNARFATGSQIEFGLCDQQLLLAIDGRTVISRAYERPSGPPAETLHPLAIGARGLNVEITQLRVWRDLYHLDPQSLPRRWETGPHSLTGVALLGDNPSVSIDSRHWQPNFLALDSILGIVRRPFWIRDRN